MKVTLVLDNGIRLTAPLGEQDALELLNDFITKLGVRHQEERPTTKPPGEEAKAVKTESRPSGSSDTKLIAYKCDGCGNFKVFKVAKSMDVGDVLSCRCGHEIQIRSITTATGDCVNCATRFYGMHLINGLNEIICRNCGSPIDLIEKTDGTLTGSHNLKY